VSLRVSALCGLLAPVTFIVGWLAGGLAQPGAYSFVRDDISDLGALTANRAWIYNQIGANLTGLLMPERPRSHQVTAGPFCSAGLLRPSILDGLPKMRTGLEQDLERESRGAAGREQMPRLPEVCVRVGQIRCFGLVEAKPFELIDSPQGALAVQTRLKSPTTLYFAVLHISPRRIDNSFRALAKTTPS
jgi:hypothetical protein